MEVHDQWIGHFASLEVLNELGPKAQSNAHRPEWVRSQNCFSKDNPGAAAVTIHLLSG